MHVLQRKRWRWALGGPGLPKAFSRSSKFVSSPLAVLLKPPPPTSQLSLGESQHHLGCHGLCSSAQNRRPLAGPPNT